MTVAVIGSGPTGAAAALELSSGGLEVDILDGGVVHEAPDEVRALARTVRAGELPSDAQMRWLRDGADRKSFGRSMSKSFSLVRGRIDPADLEKRILGSTFAFRDADRSAPLTGGWLPRSAAVGGLANAWGAACYTLRAEDYRDWPIAADEMRPGFERAAALLGLTGEVDPLAEAYPVLGPLAPVSGKRMRDPESVFEALLRRWSERSAELERIGIRAGRSRLAVSPPGEAGHDCVRCGLCVYGCATGAIWTPARLLNGGSPRLRHLPGRMAGVVEGRAPRLFVHGTDREDSAFQAGPYEAVFLAAGALGSFRIAARSLGRASARTTLLENDMYIVPFALEKGMGRTTDVVRFALSEGVLALDPGVAADRAVHIQLYRVTEPLLGPLAGVIASLPTPFHGWARRMMSGYVLGFVYMHSSDSRRIRVSIRGQDYALAVETDAAARDAAALGRVLDVLHRVSHLTGLRPLDRFSRTMPPGFSAHLGGTLPLCAADHPDRLTTSEDGTLRGADGIRVVDLSILPAVPAQNATLTGVANAVRVARRFLTARAA